MHKTHENIAYNVGMFWSFVESRNADDVIACLKCNPGPPRLSNSTLTEEEIDKKKKKLPKTECV